LASRRKALWQSELGPLTRGLAVCRSLHSAGTKDSSEDTGLAHRLRVVFDLVPLAPFLLISAALVLARQAAMSAAALAGQEDCPR